MSLNKRKFQIDCATCSGRKNSIFCSLEGESLKDLNEEKNTNQYKKGQNLFLEGNPAFGLFCVHSGKVKVTKSNIDGRESIVRILKSGDVVGHRSLFSDAPNLASATVIENGTICFVSKDTVQKLIQKEPKLAGEIIHRLSKEMGAAEEKLASMAKKNVRERFAETLLLLKETFGIECDKGYRIDINLTREEYAQMVGAASENIIRLISSFKEEGYLKQEKKQLILIDIPALEREASLSL